MQNSSGGRVIVADNIHFTLVFLGSVPVERIDKLRTIGASLRVERFRLDLARAGCWKRSQVGWIAPEHVPAPLEVLVMQLRQRLLQAEFSVDDKPFAPHVTLLRKAKCSAKTVQPDTPFVWSVDRFVLVRSETLQTGPVYSKIEEWSMD